MALTLNNFYGAETGGTEEFSGISGIPTYSTSIKRSGTYSLELLGALGLNAVQIPLTALGVTSAGNNYILGFGIYIVDTTPTVLRTLLAFCINANLSSDYSFNLDTNGNCVIGNANNAVAGTIVNPFTANTWHYIEIYHVKSNTGSLEVFIDGVSKLIVASSDFDDSGGAGNFIQIQSSLVIGENYYYDDVYLLSGATSSSQRLGTSLKITKAYQKTDGTGTDIGSALTTGTWANVSQTPLNETNTAVYNVGVKGAMNTNSGTRLGPSGDTSILSGSTFLASKFTIRAMRSGGGASTHLHRIGKNGTIASEFTVALTTSYATFNRLDITTVDLANDYMTHGFGSNAGGGQSMTTADMWVTILYIENVNRRRVLVN